MGQFVGVMLIVLGVLMAALCGLCTVFVSLASLDMPRDPQGYGGGGMVGIALILGGVPALFGLVMVWAGIAVLRGSRKQAPPAKSETFE
jgi:hypothetical protein